MCAVLVSSEIIFIDAGMRRLERPEPRLILKRSATSGSIYKYRYHLLAILYKTMKTINCSLNESEKEDVYFLQN